MSRCQALLTSKINLMDEQIKEERIKECMDEFRTWQLDHKGGTWVDFLLSLADDEDGTK